MIALSTARAVNKATGKFALSDDDQRHLIEFEKLLDRVRDRTRAVAERYHVGCYLVGRAGASKTFTVLETLKLLNTPYVYRNSRMSPLGLYLFLEEHPDHTCVIDDIPALMDQRQSLQIIMAALGGEPGQPRPVTYTTKNKNEHNKSFYFAGGLIAISNVPLRRDPLADAVASRIVVLEHEPSDEMIAAFMRAQAFNGYEDMSPQECLNVVEFVIAKARASDYRVDLRAMKKAYQDYRFAKHGKAISSWQELVVTSLKQMFRDAPVASSKHDEIDSQIEHIRRLMARHPGDTERQMMESGLGRSTFYARRRQAQARADAT